MAARAEVWLSTAGGRWGFERDGTVPAAAAAAAAASAPAAGAAVDVACPIDSKWLMQERDVIVMPPT